MAHETLRAPAAPLLMFHGTSSAHVDAILAHGLARAPEARTSSTLTSSADAHLIAFDGAYLSLDPERALGYARRAAEVFGGDPVIVTAQVVPTQAHPDEDEMLWVIKCQFQLVEEERDYEPGFAGLFRDPAYRKQFALETVNEIRDAFKPDGFDREAVLEHFEVLLEGVALLPPERESVVGDKGWLVQPWARAMARTPEGLARYRTALDGLCRAVVGPRPTDETCGIDGYKLRVPAGVPLEGGSFIAAVGSPEDPTRDLDRLDETDCQENPFAAKLLPSRGPAPR